MVKTYSNDEIEKIINNIKEEKVRIALALIKEQGLRINEVTTIYLNTKWVEEGNTAKMIETNENSFVLISTVPKKRTIVLPSNLFNKLKEYADNKKIFRIGEQHIRNKIKESAQEQGFKEFSIKDLLYSLKNSGKKVNINIENTFKHLIPTMPKNSLAIKPLKKNQEQQGIKVIIKPTIVKKTSEDNAKKENVSKDIPNKLPEKSIIVKKKNRTTKQKPSQAIYPEYDFIQSKYWKYDLDKLEKTHIFYEAEDLYNQMTLACIAENNRIKELNYSKENQNELDLYMKKIMMDYFLKWLIKQCNQNYFLAMIIFQYIKVSQKDKLYDNIKDWLDSNSPVVRPNPLDSVLNKVEEANKNVKEKEDGLKKAFFDNFLSGIEK